MDRQSTLRLNYFYRRLTSADWAYQQVGPATLANLIGTSETPAVDRSYVHEYRVPTLSRFLRELRALS